MEEAGVDEHLPDDRVAPVVGLPLREDLYLVVVVSGCQHHWRGVNLTHGDADQVSSQLLIGTFKCHFIVVTLTHGIADNAITVTDEQQDSSLVCSVQRCDISD